MKTICKVISNVENNIFQHVNQVKALLLISSLLFFITGTIFSQSERTTPGISHTTTSTSSGKEYWKDTTKAPLTIVYDTIKLNSDQKISFPINKNDDCAKIVRTALKDFSGKDIGYNVDSVSFKAINNLSKGFNGVLKIKLKQTLHDKQVYFAIFWDMKGCETNVNSSTMRIMNTVPTTITTTTITDWANWSLILFQKNRRPNYTDAVALPDKSVNTNAVKAVPVKANNTNPTKATSPTKVGRANAKPVIDIPVKKIGENK